jgi:hypothetical protein
MTRRHAYDWRGDSGGIQDVITFCTVRFIIVMAVPFYECDTCRWIGTKAEVPRSKSIGVRLNYDKRLSKRRACNDQAISPERV